MNLALWIAAGVLAVAFFAAGLIKLLSPQEKLATTMGWVEEFSPGVVKLIGAMEILGAIGLVLPALFEVAIVFVPLAATGLAIVMALAIMVHARRNELQMIVLNVILLAGAFFVAYGRFGPHAF